MAVTRVSSEFADGNTLTMPSHQEHDLIIAIIYRHDSTTSPTVPSGWRLKGARNGTTSNIRIYEKVAANSSETFGTWTNATQVAAVVYRSNDNKLLTSTATAVGSGTSTAISYTALNSSALGEVSSFVLGSAGVKSHTSNAEGAPSGMTNIGSIAGASAGELTVHDTNAEVASWSTTTFTASTSEVFASLTLAIQETQHPVPSGGGGGASAYAFFG